MSATHSQPQTPRLDIQEHKTQRRDESSPENQQPEQHPHERRRWSQVSERFGSEEPREGVLDETGVDVGLLVEEHVWDGGEGLSVGGEGGGVGVGELGGEREGVDSEGGTGFGGDGERKEEDEEGAGGRVSRREWMGERERGAEGKRRES